MIKINNFKADKYNNGIYIEVEEGIYKVTDDFDFSDTYLTSLSFVQEPELGVEFFVIWYSTIPTSSLAINSKVATELLV